MDVFNPDEAYKGDSNVIQVAYRLGLELEIWSEVANKWVKRADPFRRPISHRVFYRIKPNTNLLTGEQK